jgi:hypothetical protein
MTKTKDGVLPRSDSHVRMPPGTPTPRSGVYEQVGPRGGRTGEQADSTRGKPLPPTYWKEGGWTLVKPTRHKS